MTHDDYRNFLGIMFTHTKHMRMETLRVHGDQDFTAWEWEIKFVQNSDDPAHDLRVGQRIVQRGVSLQHWREVKVNDGDAKDGNTQSRWEIYKTGDYWYLAEKTEPDLEETSSSNKLPN